MNIIPQQDQAQLFREVIGRCTSLMRVHGSSRFLQTACALFNDDAEIRTRWRQTLEFYNNFRPSENNQRITHELVECLNAFVSDEQMLMIGLDSPSSLKNVLINCMRIVTEPDFTVEIVTAFGGTNVPLNLRIPAYAVAGIALLKRLLALRQKFPSVPDMPVPGTIRSLHFF